MKHLWTVRAWRRRAAGVLLAATFVGCAARTQTASAPAVVSSPPVVHDLRTFADLSVAFDRDRDHPRIVLLLSPTCPVCVDGARWVRQNVLAANPNAELRVYAVWFDNFEGDEREYVQSGLLADRRVTQMWDDQKLAGRWYARSLTRPDDPEWLEWDAFFVYPPGVTWEQAGARPLSWGRTIVGKSEQLRSAVAQLLEKPTPP